MIAVDSRAVSLARLCLRRRKPQLALTVLRIAARKGSAS